MSLDTDRDVDPLAPGVLREFVQEHAATFSEPFVVAEAMDWLDALVGHRARAA